MADDGGLTKEKAVDIVASAILVTRRAMAARQPSFWRKLDAGEYKLKAMFPNTLMTTGFNGATLDGVAFLNLYRWSRSKEQYELVIQFEEDIHEFPSEHLIAQIALVV